MELHDALVPPVALVAPALVGRVALSVLPAGNPGSHRIASLPLTWAASHALGWILLVAEQRALDACGVTTNAIALLAPWALLATLRIATLPGAMTPRHEPIAERSSGIVRALSWASALLVVVASLRATTSDDSGRVSVALAELVHASPPALSRARVWITAASDVALLVLVAHGLATARRAPHGRAVVVAALAAVIALRTTMDGQPERSLHALSIGAAASFGIAALRRADRRAAVLCALCAAGAALYDSTAWALSAVTLVVFVLRAPSPMRARIAKLACASAVVVAIVARPFVWHRGVDFAPDFERVRTSTLAAGVSIAIGAVALGWKILRPSRRTDAVPSDMLPIDEPRNELAFLRDLLLAGLAALALQSAHSTHALAASLVPLLPVCALMIGLAVVRSERATRIYPGERD